MQRTTIFLPEDLEQRLVDAARRQHRARAELVREALRAYLDNLPSRPRPASIGAAHTGGRGDTSETVKDAVRGEWRRAAR